MSPENEVWQVEVNGQIYETNFVELVEWINEGAVLREDKVKRGNLRWLEAGKIPKLISFFNAKESNFPSPIVNTTAQPIEETHQIPTAVFQNNPNDENINYPASQSSNFTDTPQIDSETQPQTFVQTHVNPNACAIHNEVAPDFVCESCSTLFCYACPKTYGGKVKTCPMCGSLCLPLSPPQTENGADFQYQQKMGDGFGFADLKESLGYPFQYKTSFIAGGLMFAFFTIGQSATAIGGIFMAFAAIFCYMLTNMLTFGILANTVENFSQGRIGTNFMPNFDDFELWNDVIQPFFLSIGVYIVSFGLFAAVLFGTFYYIFSSVSQTIKEQSAAAMTPGAQRNLQSAQQIPQIEQIPAQINKNNQFENGEIPNETEIAESQNFSDTEDDVQRVQEMINEHRQLQVESIAGKSPESQQAEYVELGRNLAKTALPLLLLAFLALFWGMFYFPAACLVAGYTRSFVATINPLIGLDTIKRLGVDYIKILFMGLFLLCFSALTSFCFLIVFSPFNMPMVGNLPAKVLGSFVTFYISIVFSVILGFAMYKNAHKFNIFRR